MNLIVSAVARTELDEALAFYAAQASSRVVQSFWMSYLLATDRLRLFPRSGSPFSRGMRKLPFGDFPYALIYKTDENDEIFILHIAHHARRPGYWEAGE